MDKQRKIKKKEKSKLGILVSSMLKEEYRFHLTLSGRSYFFLFMYLIVIFTFITAITLPYISESGGYGGFEIQGNDVSIQREVLIVHFAIIMYGMGIGAFAFTGKGMIERQFGQINLLVSSPETLPLKQKEAFFALFIRDGLFYMPVVIAPMTLGLICSVPFNDFELKYVLFFSFALCLSFIIGISLSFFVSAMYAHSLKVFATTIITIIIIILLILSINPSSVKYAVPTITLQFDKNIESFLISIGFILLFSSLAMTFAKEMPEITRYANSVYLETEERWSFFKKSSSLLAKEFIDLNRSMAIIKILISFTVPLIFFAVISWYVENSMKSEELSFHPLLWATMVGFLGILSYNWLTTIDNLESYRVLPISVPKVIKVKILLYILLTSGFSICYIIIISWLLGELPMLVFALPVMLITSLYVVISTAYLTGLKMNAYLLNPAIMIKFFILAMVPLLSVELLSLVIEEHPEKGLTTILGICIFMLLASYVLYNGIDSKWAREEFGGV